MRNMIFKLTCSVIFKRTGMMVRFENVEDTSMQELRTILIDACGVGGKTGWENHLFKGAHSFSGAVWCVTVRAELNATDRPKTRSRPLAKCAFCR